MELLVKKEIAGNSDKESPLSLSQLRAIASMLETELTVQQNDLGDVHIT